MFGIISNGKGEYVEFSEMLNAVGEVEMWMGRIEKMMTHKYYLGRFQNTDVMKIPNF